MKYASLIFLFVAFLSTQAFSQEKFGYFSSSELISLFPEATTIQAEIEKLSKEKQAIGSALEKDLEAKVKNYEAEKDKLADIIKETRVEEINNLKVKTQKYYNEARKEIDTKRQEMLKPLITKVNEAIKSVGSKGKYTAIIDLDAGGQFLLYIDESKNIIDVMKKELGLK